MSQDFADREAEAAGRGLQSEDRRAYANGSLPLRHFLEETPAKKPERVHPRIAAAVLALAETPADDALAVALRRVELAKAIEATPKGSNPRNYPCPCGSGKKFKKCCGHPAAAPKANPNGGTQ